MSGGYKTPGQRIRILEATVEVLEDEKALLDMALGDALKERERLLVLATKWCPREHHDWEELMKFSMLEERKQDD